MFNADASEFVKLDRAIAPPPTQAKTTVLEDLKVLGPGEKSGGGGGATPFSP
jgi:hypothetical protein